MIIAVSEIVTSGLIWLSTEIHGWNKGHAAAQQQLIIDKKQYCPPAYTLPNDLAGWKIELYKTDCQGMHGYLNKDIPEKLMSTPTTQTDVPLR